MAVKLPIIGAGQGRAMVEITNDNNCHYKQLTAPPWARLSKRLLKQPVGAIGQM